MRIAVFAFLAFVVSFQCQALELTRDEVKGKDVFIDAARGSYPSSSAVSIVGYDGDADCSTAAVVCWEADAAYTFQTTARTMYVSGTAASDASGGTGVRTLTISGLDGSYAAVSETVGMTGATVATTTATFLRVNEVKVATAGSNSGSAGAMTVRSSTDTYRAAYLSAGQGRANQAIYTVPVSKSLYLTNYDFGSYVGGITALSTGVVFKVQERPYGGAWIDRAIITNGGYSGTKSAGEFVTPIKVAAKSDIRVLVSGRPDNVVASCVVNGVLVND